MNNGFCFYCYSPCEGIQITASKDSLGEIYYKINCDWELLSKKQKPDKKQSSMRHWLYFQTGMFVESIMADIVYPSVDYFLEIASLKEGK